MGPLCPCPNSKKPMKKIQGASHGTPTDPGPEFPYALGKVSCWENLQSYPGAD
ncbi:unnamed protein product [Staurois parvus]|uniref:Uncharacterized protein n=1 Tax=Staurois parvus TaxID=386267 RepID=A0ABN9C7Q8_9NEOB|nr:unnamed protein product [Staurois parvus]